MIRLFIEGQEDQLKCSWTHKTRTLSGAGFLNQFAFEWTLHMPSNTTSLIKKHSINFLISFNSFMPNRSKIGCC